jgi:hypothetical protein
MNIVESQELLRSFQAAISRSQAPRVFLSSPSQTPDGLQIQRPPLSSKHTTALCGGQRL